MKRSILVTTCQLSVVIAVALCCSAGNSGNYEITRLPDGPFSFSISGITVNSGSSMSRESILFNDPGCPVQVKGHSTSIKYKDREFRFQGLTSIQVDRPITALQVRTLLYDVFGQHMKGLEDTQPKDLRPGATTVGGEWRAYESDLAELLTTVTYVARVRLDDGTQWVFNADNLLLALASLNLEKKISEEPSK